VRARARAGGGPLRCAQDLPAKCPPWVRFWVGMEPALRATRKRAALTLRLSSASLSSPLRFAALPEALETVERYEKGLGEKRPGNWMSCSSAATSRGKRNLPALRGAWEWLRAMSSRLRQERTQSTPRRRLALGSFSAVCLLVGGLCSSLSL
jgi:hypothetical protein